MKTDYYQCMLVGQKNEGGQWTERYAYVVFKDMARAKNFIEKNYENKHYNLSGLKKSTEDWAKFLLGLTESEVIFLNEEIK
jgi:hypothetical protein